MKDYQTFRVLCTGLCEQTGNLKSTNIFHITFIKITFSASPHEIGNGAKMCTVENLYQISNQ